MEMISQQITKTKTKKRFRSIRISFAFVLFNLFQISIQTCDILRDKIRIKVELSRMTNVYTRHNLFKFILILECVFNI